MSVIIEVKNLTKKYWARTAPFILLFLCTSMVFVSPALAEIQFHIPMCSVKFDKNFYRPGETVTVYGAVTEDGKPVEGANVVVNITDFGLYSLEVITDSKGNWTMSFKVPDEQEFGTWPVEVTLAHGEFKTTYIHTIQVGEVENGDDVGNIVESLETQIAELEAENQMLQGRIQELEDEIQRLQEVSGGLSFGTLGIVVSGVVVICLAVFAIMHQRSSQRSNRSTM